MRRENRKKNNSYKSIYITGGVLLLAIATFVITFIIYSNKLDNDIFALDSEYLAQYTSEGKNTIVSNKETTSASSGIGKTVEESKNTIVNNVAINSSKSDNSEKESTSRNDIEKEEKKSNSSKSTKEKDPTFIKPIEGEIFKEYAKDSLVYSNTLKEWTTHFGIDIKAERASVVKSSADGTVKYIKNDPRYGLTIIIEHSNGFETRYANLLTTEFVSEEEVVKAGQTIGTVGDSSVFEIVDEPHLHFEILKNSEPINPIEYVNF